MQKSSFPMSPISYESSFSHQHRTRRRYDYTARLCHQNYIFYNSADELSASPRSPRYIVSHFRVDNIF
jgi:hypothetical protein